MNGSKYQIMKNFIEEDIKSIISENLDWKKLSGKNILITGASGMLPAYLIDVICYLVENKIIENVLLLALVRNLDYAQNRFKIYSKIRYLRFVVQDVNKDINIKEDINVIIHAASQASPKYYINDPVGTLLPNITGTINLLNLARKKNVENFIYFSSSEVYGNYLGESIDETNYGSIDPLEERSCYSESKRMGETICISWFRQYNIPIKIIRPFHTYGPGMKIGDGRAFVDFAFNIINSENIDIRSDGTAIRSYCYLKDAALAYFYILFEGENGQAYNVGNPYEQYSIKELAQILIDLFPRKKLSITLNPEYNDKNYKPSSINRSVPNIEKIRKLGWEPKTDVKSGFFRTINSYQ